MWLLQNTTVPQNQLSQRKWIVFHNITEAYTRSFDDHSLSFRLALGGSCTGVNPSNLGLTSKSGKESIIVGYSKSGGISDEDARRAFGLLAQVHQNQRRQVDAVSAPNNQSTIDFTTQNCRLYPFNVSFYIPVVVGNLFLYALLYLVWLQLKKCHDPSFNLTYTTDQFCGPRVARLHCAT